MRFINWVMKGLNSSYGPPSADAQSPGFWPRLTPNMEALGGYPTKSSDFKAKLFKVLLSVTVCMGSLYLIQTKLSKSRKPKDFYSYEVKDARGRSVSLEKYRGKVSYAIQNKLSNVLFEHPGMCTSALMLHIHNDIFLCRDMWVFAVWW